MKYANRELEPEVDFKYFIKLALFKKLPWETLNNLLEGLTHTLAKSKELNQILLHELKTSEFKYQDHLSRCIHQSEVLKTDKISNDEKDADCSNFDEDADMEFIDQDDDISEHSDNKMDVKTYNFEYDFISSNGIETKQSIIKTSINPREKESGDTIEEKLKNQFATEPTDEFEDEVNEDKIHASSLENTISAQNEKKSFQCKICHKSYERKKGLKDHQILHSVNNPFKCRICSKMFRANSELKRHERIHTSDRPFECETCKKRFNDLGTLNRHSRIHSGEKPYECKTCTKKFNDLGSLNRHLIIHSGEKPYECKTCKKKFNNSGSMKRHFIIHTGEKPYECKTCKKAFNCPNNLKRHSNLHQMLIA